MTMHDRPAEMLRHLRARGFTPARAAEIALNDDWPKRLLQVDTNAKTVKGQKLGFLTGILYLAPADLSGFEVCPMRSPQCSAACLNTAGRGGMTSVQRARMRKTLAYFADRDRFMEQLMIEISALVRKAKRKGLVPLVRLNGTSDIPWERVPVITGATGAARNIMALFPGVQFYDYTKVSKRAITAGLVNYWKSRDVNMLLQPGLDSWPANYHLTFSLTEANDREAAAVIENHGNVAIVFPAGAPLPDTYRVARFVNVPVVDGDTSDVRHLDPCGTIVGLKAKGKARKVVPSSGPGSFVREV